MKPPPPVMTTDGNRMRHASPQATATLKALPMTEPYVGGVVTHSPGAGRTGTSVHRACPGATLAQRATKARNSPARNQ